MSETKTKNLDLLVVGKSDYYNYIKQHGENYEKIDAFAGKAVKSFNTVAEMVAATYLVVGDRVQMWGEDDLGDAQYKRVISGANDGTGILLNNGLYANLFVNSHGVEKNDIIKLKMLDTRKYPAKHRVLVEMEDDDGGTAKFNVMQDVCFSEEDNRMFISQHSGGAGGLVLINEMKLDGTQVSNERFLLAGHGQGMSTEKVGATTYLWLGGDVDSRFIHRINWDTKAVDKYVFNGENSDPHPCLSIDKKHLIVSAGSNIYIYDFEEFKADSVNATYTSFKLNDNQDPNTDPTHVQQGIASKDGLIYVTTGEAGGVTIDTDTLLYCYDFKGNVIYNQIVNTYNYFAKEDGTGEVHETEGMEFYHDDRTDSYSLVFGMASGDQFARVNRLFEFCDDAEFRRKVPTIDAVLQKPTGTFGVLAPRMIMLRIRRENGVWVEFTSGNPTSVRNSIKEIIQTNVNLSDGITVVLKNRFLGTMGVFITPDQAFIERGLAIANLPYAGGKTSNNVEFKFYDLFDNTGTIATELPAGSARIPNGVDIYIMLVVADEVEQSY